MSRYVIPVVFDVESDPPMPLGVYSDANVDGEGLTVAYERPDGKIRHAPADCVVTVDCVVVRCV